VSQERTPLSSVEEMRFRQWAAANNITDVDAPQSKYDYRGYWKDIAAQGGDQTKEYEDGLHFPDTYKQHGHPTFSVESKYSGGAEDGGRWAGEQFVPAGADLLGTSRRSVASGPLEQALLQMLKRR
jgi:hypothetical protein